MKLESGLANGQTGPRPVLPVYGPAHRGLSHCRAMPEPIAIIVPLLNESLEPPPPARIRALKKHLIQSLRDLRRARRPEKLIQTSAPAPIGFTAEVLNAGCATCQGHCCKGGGEHAYIDERTMARVRRDYPDLDAGKIIGLYLARLAPSSYRLSCLFHGPLGCTLGRTLRAELCNAYYCNGLRDFLKLSPKPEFVQIVARRGGMERRSPVLSDDGGQVA